MLVEKFVLGKIQDQLEVMQFQMVMVVILLLTGVLVLEVMNLFPAAWIWMPVIITQMPQKMMVHVFSLKIIMTVMETVQLKLIVPVIAVAQPNLMNAAYVAVVASQKVSVTVLVM